MGRWIGCSRGWYPIVVELDQQLAALFPGYKLEQVKEKYGRLRFYWSQGEQVTDPADPEPAYPTSGDGANEEEKRNAWAEWEKAYTAWQERLDSYLASREGAVRQGEFERRSKLAEQLVDAAEQRARITCELCGQTGSSCRTQGAHPWYRTLCATCAAEHDYIPTRPVDATE